MHNDTYEHKILENEYMRTTLNIDDSLVKRASILTGIKEKTSLVRLGLEALIDRESSKRLAKLGGTEKNLKIIPRRRMEGS
jgi:Arc/MetJ family transcription regulator